MATSDSRSNPNSESNPNRKPYTLSPAALQARQNNAKRSTGPRSEAGKAVSRLNALKHGLSGGVLLTQQDAAAFQKKLADWKYDILPQGPVEHELVEIGVLAAVRAGRCRREDESGLARRRRQALDRVDRKRDRRLRTLAGDFNLFPEQVIGPLQEFSEGVDWLLQKWDLLKQILDEKGYFTFEEATVGLGLLGQTTLIRFRPDEPAAFFWRDVLAASPNIDLEELDRFYSTSTSHLRHMARLADAKEKLPSQAEARAGLRSLVEREIARLEALLQQLWTEVDAPLRAEAPERVWIDKSRQGALRRRYEAEQTSLLFRTLKELSRIRRQGPSMGRDRDLDAQHEAEWKQHLASQQTASTSPEPASRNEPKSDVEPAPRNEPSTGSEECPRTSPAAPESPSRIEPKTERDSGSRNEPKSTTPTPGGFATQISTTKGFASPMIPPARPGSSPNSTPAGHSDPTTPPRTG